MNRPLSDESVKFRRRKADLQKYMRAREGDWLLAPFQCERCWFIDMFYQEPNPLTNLKDQVLLHQIKRVNLDIFWSRELSTVRKNLATVKEQISKWKGRYGVFPFPEIKPWKMGEARLSMMTAMSVLEKSTEEGRLSKDYTQFNTCRQIRSVISNMVGATFASLNHCQTYKSRLGHVFHSYDDPTQNSVVERFIAGMKARMPVDFARNLPLMGSVVKRILDNLELEMFGGVASKERKRLLTMVGGYIAVTYSYSLRGNEGFWVDGDSLVKEIDVGKEATPIPHVLVPVIGFFKAEHGERMHVFCLANQTKSGIQVRVWLERVVSILREEKKAMCPAFCDAKGYMMQSYEVEGVIHPILKEIQHTRELEQDLPFGVDVELFYRCDRSFRRGGATTASNNGISKEIIEFVHRWSNYEKNKGRPPNHNMLQHYADGARTRPLQLAFTSSV